MAQIKGTAIRGLLKHVKESGRPGGIAAVIAKLPAQSRPIFDQRILASSWYPYIGYGDLLQVLADSAGGNPDAYLHQLGRWAAMQDAGTTFKVVRMFASVETMLQRSELFWSRHCDTGTFKTVDMQKGSGAGVLRDFPEVYPVHCRLLAGWIEGMGEAAGAAKATVQKVACIHRGDDRCEYRGRWT